MKIHQFAIEGHFQRIAEEGKGRSERSVLQFSFSLNQSNIKGGGVVSLDYIK